MKYDDQIQQLFLEMMVDDPERYVRVQNIYNVKNFDSSLQPVAKFIEDHAGKYNTLPNLEQIKATTGIELTEINKTLDKGHVDWYLDEFEKFTRRQEVERAILISADMLHKDDFDPVVKMVKDAVEISLTKDMGLDYFADPRARLQTIMDSKGQIKTGWNNLDSKLYGGFNKGELNIFTGGSGAGKSLFLQNIAINLLEQQYNGIFITLELSEELCSMRLDAMNTDMTTRDLFKQLDKVELKIKMLAKTSGKFRIKYLPAQSTINDIRSYIKEYQIQTGIKNDFICVDYLDLLMPVSIKVSPSDLFVKDKYVSEELRNLGKELDLVVITASQLNRGSVDEAEFDHSHISGGISKIQTADNVFGIYTSKSMKERGRYQLQFMKTRSSNGVGQKIELEFNVDSLRIMDTGLDAYDTSDSSSSASAIMNKIKPKSVVKTNTEEPDTNINKKLGSLVGKMSSL